MNLIKNLFTHGRRSICCDLTLEARQIECLKMHTNVHKGDWRLFLPKAGLPLTEERYEELLRRRFGFPPKVGLPLTARNVLAYGIMQEFVFFGSLSVFDPIIGIIALLSSSSSGETFRYLCALANEETGESLPPDEFRVQASKIQGGSCTVVSIPGAAAAGEAQLIGIVTDNPLERVLAEKPKERDTTIVYFTLSATAQGAFTLGEWGFRMSADDPNFADYEREFKAEPTPFVDGIEALMKAGGWDLQTGKLRLKRGDLEGATKALQSVLNSDSHNRLKLDAFIDLALIRAVSGSEVIRLPGIPFEYAIMKRHFCRKCGKPTENWRQSANTRYLGPTIVDYWRTECRSCGEEGKVEFALPAGQ